MAKKNGSLVSAREHQEKLMQQFNACFKKQISKEHDKTDVLSALLEFTAAIVGVNLHTLEDVDMLMQAIRQVTIEAYHMKDELT